MASAMGSWWAQLAPEMYCVILDTMSGVSCTARGDQKGFVGCCTPAPRIQAAMLGAAERLLWPPPPRGPGEGSEACPSPEEPSPGARSPRTSAAHGGQREASWPRLHWPCPLTPPPSQALRPPQGPKKKAGTQVASQGTASDSGSHGGLVGCASGLGGRGDVGTRMRGVAAWAQGARPAPGPHRRSGPPAC